MEAPDIADCGLRIADLIVDWRIRDAECVNESAFRIPQSAMSA
jgi:hypothetical protein